MGRFAPAAFAALLIVGVASRLVPHLPNATAITALAIVAAHSGSRWRALALPLLALLISDWVIGWYDWRILATVYGSFALVGLCAWYLRRQGLVGTLVFASVSSFGFFLTTNFAVWLFSSWYDKSLAGLLYAYELGLPFLRNMFLGDVLYTLGLLGAYELARYGLRYRRHPHERLLGGVRAGIGS